MDVTDHDKSQPPNELTVFIIKAHGLKIMDKNRFSKGGSTDPLFSMVLGEETQKTTVKKKNLDPTYNEKFAFGMRNNAAAKLAIVCDDYDMGSGNDFLGRCEVDLEPLKDREERREWHALGDEGNTVGADIGHVLVGVKWVFNPARVSIVDQPLDWSSPPFECADVVDGDVASEPAKNELNIFLIRAHGLKIMDKNTFSKGGSSDPLVTMTVGDETLKSTAKKKTLEPEWGERFELPVKSEAAVLRVQVDDYDLVGSNGEF